MKHKGYENIAKYHQVKDVLIDKLILLISITANVWRTVWRICMPISGFKGLKKEIRQLECISNVLKF